MANPGILKYPRTPHLEGSRLQPGDEDLSQVPFAQIAGKRIVVEEKLDGANTAISFGADGSLLLQSRGHYLTGGYREKHYDLFKQWAHKHSDRFYRVLGSRYILYGEWLYAKHSVFYDALPEYFLEFDILDRATGRFLDTANRRAMLKGQPIVSVPVLESSAFTRLEDITSLLGPSRFIHEGHMQRLRQWCLKSGLNAQKAIAETDPSTTMEGLYLKVEEGGQVMERMKFVRASFAQCVSDSGTHWLERPIIPNQLGTKTEALSHGNA